MQPRRGRAEGADSEPTYAERQSRCAAIAKWPRRGRTGEFACEFVLWVRAGRSKKAAQLRGGKPGRLRLGLRARVRFYRSHAAPTMGTQIGCFRQGTENTYFDGLLRNWPEIRAQLRSRLSRACQPLWSDLSHARSSLNQGSESQNNDRTRCATRPPAAAERARICLARCHSRSSTGGFGRAWTLRSSRAANQLRHGAFVLISISIKHQSMIDLLTGHTP